MKCEGGLGRGRTPLGGLSCSALRDEDVGARGKKGILTLQDAIQMPPPQEVFLNVPSPFLNSSTLGLSMSGGN